MRARLDVWERNVSELSNATWRNVSRDHARDRKWRHSSDNTDMHARTPQLSSAVKSREILREILSWCGLERCKRNFGFVERISECKYFYGVLYVINRCMQRVCFERFAMSAATEDQWYSNSYDGGDNDDNDDGDVRKRTLECQLEREPK